MELETDKAVVEVPSSVTGTVGEVRVKEGDKLRVGQVIFTVENGAGSAKAAASPEVANPIGTQVTSRVTDQITSEDRPSQTADKTVSEVPKTVPSAPIQPASPATNRRSSDAPAPTEFKLPELGENIDSGDLVRLMISPGARVAEGQPVMELETDKAVVEVPSIGQRSGARRQSQRGTKSKSRAGHLHARRRGGCAG